MWNHNPPNFDYEVAPREHSMEQARLVLDQLYGTHTKQFPVVDDGPCEDRCGRTGIRVRFGRFAVCRACALCRRRARDKVR